MARDKRVEETEIEFGIPKVAKIRRKRTVVSYGKVRKRRKRKT